MKVNIIFHLQEPPPKKTLKNKSNCKNSHFHTWTDTLPMSHTAKGVTPENPDDHGQRI